MKVILYHGIDFDFFDKLNEAAKGVSQCLVFRHSPDKGTLIDHVLESKPHIVIIDSIFSGYLCEEVRQLKLLSDFRSTLFVGYCKDELEAKEGEQLLVAGVHLFYLKDTDFENFFRDCIQIAFETRSTSPDFARAKNLEIPMELGFISSLTAVSADSLVLETDLALSDEVLVSVPMSVENAEIPMKITEKIEGHLTSPFLYSYKMTFSYPGPWDEFTDNSLSRETVETWIGLRQKYFDTRRETIAFFTNDNDFTKSLIKTTGACWYNIYRSAMEARSSLFHVRPGVVFFDLPDLSELGEIISVLREIEPTPMVVVLNSKSDSGALRKLFDYDFLLAYPGKLASEMFHAMENKFLEKVKTSDKEIFLKPTDPDRIIPLRKKVILTSITERDLTFILDEEIPYFSVIQLSLPLPCYLTVIPAEGQLPATRKGNHYRALIHGLCEENLTKIRKIVNQLIYTPVKELSRENVEIMLKQDYAQKEKSLENAPQSPVVTNKNDDEEDERYVLKRNTRGKSKL